MSAVKNGMSFEEFSNSIFLLLISIRAALHSESSFFILHFALVQHLVHPVLNKLV